MFKRIRRVPRVVLLFVLAGAISLAAGATCDLQDGSLLLACALPASQQSPELATHSCSVDETVSLVSTGWTPRSPNYVALRVSLWIVTVAVVLVQIYLRFTFRHSRLARCSSTRVLRWAEHTVVVLASVAVATAVLPPYGAALSCAFHSHDYGCAGFIVRGFSQNLESIAVRRYGPKRVESTPDDYGPARNAPIMLHSYGDFGSLSLRREWIGLPGVAILGIACVLKRRHAIEDSAMKPCTSCGYSLIGNLSGVCPECGINTGLK